MGSFPRAVLVNINPGHPEKRTGGDWLVGRPLRKEEQMKNIIKILHIDSGWKVTYLIIRKGILMKTFLSLEATLSMLKTDPFDLILSEPQNLAILKP
jgi:hypothetical protein